jgi:hypothetical protein
VYDTLKELLVCFRYVHKVVLYMCILVDTHTCIHTYIHTSAEQRPQRYMNAQFNWFAYIYIYIYIHTHTHLYIHTYIYTYIHEQNNFLRGT